MTIKKYCVAFYYYSFQKNVENLLLLRYSCKKCTLLCIYTKVFEKRKIILRKMLCPLSINCIGFIFLTFFSQFSFSRFTKGKEKVQRSRKTKCLEHL